jgi:hypothetical protein
MGVIDKSTASQIEQRKENTMDNVKNRNNNMGQR